MNTLTPARREREFFITLLEPLYLSKRENHHPEQQESVAETADLGLAVGPAPVADRNFDDFQVHLAGSEQQIEVAERIEIAEVRAVPR